MVNLEQMRDKLDTDKNEMSNWYDEATRKGMNQARREGRKFVGVMGPGMIHHEALQEMQSKVRNLSVVHTGLERIAPEIDQQTTFVLKQVADASQALQTDAISFFMLFNSFTDSGPEQKINTMNSASLKKFYQKRTIEYAEHFSQINRRSVNIYMSQSKIKTALAMLKLQMDLAKKHSAFTNKIRRSELVKVDRHLQKLDDLLDNVTSSMTALEDEMSKAKGNKQKLYPNTKTKDGAQVRVDKIYYMVLVKHMDVLDAILDTTTSLQGLIRGIDRITDTPEEKEKKLWENREVYKGIVTVELFSEPTRKALSATLTSIGSKIAVFGTLGANNIMSAIKGSRLIGQGATFEATNLSDIQKRNITLKKMIEDNLHLMG